MVKKHFGFSDSPFENNLDQRFLFFSANHKEVTAALLYFIKWKKSFALVCGDVGTGKTMLIHYLLNRLPDSVHPIMIANPDVGYREILRYVAGILKVDAKGKRILDLVDLVKAALVEAGRRGERFVLIIDEAHLLSDKSLEQIRLLSNIETPEHKLFQILLLGQYELSYKLNRPELRQLRQRININRFLAPMDAVETIQYMDYRLGMAGSSFDACFEPHCRPLLFKMTKGVPRSINQLCDSALLICKAEKRQKVTKTVLKKAGEALRSDILFTPGSRAGSTASPWKSVRSLAAFSAGALVLILLGISGYRGELGADAHYFLQRFAPSVLAPPVVVQPPLAETATHPVLPPIEIPSSEQETPQHKDPEGDSGAAMLEMKQLLPTEAPVAIAEETGNGERSRPLPAGQDFQQETQKSLLHGPERVVVKKGDTLFGIASRFYPKNKAEGLKKILAANPLIGGTNRIYPGQKLIIPESVYYREDVH
jgi:type II secretory pathway predicted ATPase ExeA/LysM repeat protein